MKNTLLSMIGGLILLGGPSAALTQDLTNLIPVCHYTLINTPEDSLGFQDTIFLENALYEGTNGVYSNGIYPGEDPVHACHIRTPFMSTLYDSVFAIQLEFKLETFVDHYMPILICGESYRYLGLQINTINQFEILLNNNLFIPTIAPDPMAGVWYVLTIIHHDANARTEFYLNTDLIGQTNEELIRTPTEGYVSNLNPSMGRAFKGYWRNLRVYGTEPVSGLTPLHYDAQAKIYPNPSETRLHIDIPDLAPKRWTIIDMSGRIYTSGFFTTTRSEIDIQQLPPAAYLLTILDDSGKLLDSQIFVKGQ